MNKRLANKLVKLIPGSRLHDGFNAGSGQWWGVELDVNGESRTFTVDEFETLDNNMADPKDNPVIYEVGAIMDSKGCYDVLYCEGDPELMLKRSS